ncbi:MAG: PQQ-like beta-propeller repeat protein [Clostridiales bacterium]|nr:PQQ-like beta-propeller repeat protein [Clostridiales bacterium]
MFSLFFSALKKAWALLTAILLFVSIQVEKPAGEPQGAVFVGSRTFMLEEALVRGQGVTNDGEFFYFSGNFFLNKTDIKTGETVAQNNFAIPLPLLMKGCNHIGGIGYADGKIYAAIEDGSDYLHPFIAIFDAKTLKFTGKYYELPWELHVKGVPWCIVDKDRGYLYTAEWSNATQLNVFDLKDMSFVKNVAVSMTLDRIQGGDIYEGKLYLSNDSNTKRVYEVDPVSGQTRILFERNIDPECEAESMTVLATPDGPAFFVMDLGPMRINMVFREYRLSE